MEPDSVILSYRHEGATDMRVLCRIDEDNEIVFHDHDVGFCQARGCCRVHHPRCVGHTVLVVLLPLLLPAFQCIVALPFAI